MINYLNYMGGMFRPIWLEIVQVLDWWLLTQLKVRLMNKLKDTDSKGQSTQGHLSLCYEL